MEILNIETADIEVTEEDILVAVLEIEVEEEGEGEGKGEEGGDVTLRTLEAIKLLTQEADPGGTKLVDACNGFSELSRLAMLCTVRHHWPEGARFVFN